ncbi:MAG: DUF3299 domain-containing protein [Cyclobacteriaceae bacterium]|nr:DUF3299 domain-containing protein [Cyclobacteriaceae bacterium]
MINVTTHTTEPFPFRKWLLLFFLIASVLSSAYAQPRKQAVYQGFPSLIWPKLYSIQFIPNAEDFEGLDKPVFNDVVKALNGKEVTLPGYLVPFEGGQLKSNHFMLSSLPINVCFFCGGGGPETVVEVFTVNQVSYTEKPVEVKGKLFLNDKNPGQMVYVLTSAEFLGEIE